MYKIFLIGVGSDGLDPKQRQALDACTTIAVSDRFQPLTEDFAAETLPITPIAGMLSTLEERGSLGNVGILAGGDPLFFGIAGTIVSRFGPEKTEILPALSTMQLLCARFGQPWHDALFVSLHGRTAEHKAALLLQNRKTVVFTDKHNTPDVLAREILAYCREIEDSELLAQCTIMIGENLGTPSEHLVRGTPEQIAAMTFADLNIMLIRRPARTMSWDGALGLRENEISHSRGLITKDEIRAATLHHLRLSRQSVLWDIGAGSGSVALEAARLCPDCRVFAVEKHPEQLENIRKNIRKYQTYNVRVIAGTAPESLQDLPVPDRIFVGGSGGRLEDILTAAAQHLGHRGRIVVNAVTAKTGESAPLILEQQGLVVGVSTLQLVRGTHGRQVDFNPIRIIIGEKE